MLFCVGIALLGCKKDTAVAPENILTIMLHRWLYVGTFYDVTGDRTLEQPGYEIEYFKDFTYKVYQDFKLVRTGKYEILSSVPVYYKSQGLSKTDCPRVKHLDTGQIDILGLFNDGRANSVDFIERYRGAAPDYYDIKDTYKLQ